MLNTKNVNIFLGVTLGRGFKRAFATAGQDVNKLGRSVEKNNRRLQSSQRTTEKTTEETREYRREQNRLGLAIEANERRTRRYQKILNRVNNDIANSKRQLAGWGLGVGGALTGLGVLGRGAARVEEETVRLRTVINSDTPAVDMGAAIRRARDLSRRGVATETEGLQIQYALNSAGLTAEAARSGAGVVAKVARVTNGAAESVGEVIATTYNNMGQSLTGTVDERMQRIGDVLTKTQLKFQLRNFDQLGESFKTGASYLTTYNVGLAEGATALGLLNNAGLQGSEAGTALGATLRNLNKASDELGFEFVRHKNGELDLATTLGNMADAMEYMDVDERAQELQKIFGDEGLRGIAPLLKNLKALAPAIADVTQNSRGIVDKNYAYFSQSTLGQSRRLQNNFRMLGDAVGRLVLPGFNMLVGPLAEGAQWLTEQVEQYPEFAQGLGAAIAALALFKTATLTARLGALALGRAATTQAMAGNAGGVAGALMSGGKNAAKRLPWLGALLTAGTVGAVLLDKNATQQDKNQAVGRGLGGLGGALAGAKLGAMAGAVGGPLGVAIGGVLGAVLGGLLGDELGGKAADVFSDTTTEQALSGARRRAAREARAGDTYKTEIHVTQAPGEDGEALAQRVDQLVQNSMRNNYRRRSRRLTDDDE